MKLAPYTRVGLAVLSGGRTVGVVVFDDRRLHGAACRYCGVAVYDVPAVSAAAGWLGGHLRQCHGATALHVSRPDDRDLAPVARRVRAALRAPLEGRAVA